MYVCEWLKANRLSLNIKKCNYMIFNSKNKHYNNTTHDVNLSNESIQRVDTTKFLGVLIDSNLTFKYHINQIANKVVKSIGIMNRLKHIFPTAVLRTLYCSLILPYLTYCNIVWGNTFRTYTNKLVMLQKKATRLISKAHFIAHTDPLFKDLKLLNLDNINKYQQNVFMYKYANKQLPSKFQALFTFRTSTNIHLPTRRTRLFQHTIRYTGAKNWNTLPQYY